MRHCDDTIVICQLVCVIDSWAHTSFVYSILSLKLGVTHDVKVFDEIPSRMLVRFKNSQTIGVNPYAAEKMPTCTFYY